MFGGKLMQEKDSCGVGFICDVNGKKSNKIVKYGIEAVKNLTHRGAVVLM
jgi:Glutamate synthase domain 1